MEGLRIRHKHVMAKEMGGNYNRILEASLKNQLDTDSLVYLAD